MATGPPARVAKEAGVGRATVYRHWAGRTALLRDALGHARFPPPAPTGDLVRDAVALLGALRTALVDGPLRSILAALVAEALTDPDTRDLLDALLAQGHDGLRHLLKEAQQAGQVAPDLVVLQAVELLGGLVFYLAFCSARTWTTQRSSVQCARSCAWTPLLGPSLRDEQPAPAHLAFVSVGVRPRASLGAIVVMARERHDGLAGAGMGVWRT
ncbi:MAG: TetR/AcrR family transcriptional regulator C-terminal ligand-binding domain-containing protein [Myxococcota bacterium]